MEVFERLQALLASHQARYRLIEHPAAGRSVEVAAIRGTAVSQGAKASVAAREYLSFRLGTEEYGIDILRVQEIRGYEQPTRLVGAPEFIRGVLNLRGVIVPIVDLRVRFGIDAGFDTFTVTVVLNVAGRTVGAVVDSVSDVLELSADNIKPAPEFNGAIDAGQALAQVSDDFDRQARSGSYDIGADEYGGERIFGNGFQ